MGNSGCVLIADDEQTFLESTADLLRREGFCCDCVSDAEAGIEKLATNDYDVLIADIKMPGNPDLELIRKLPQVAEGVSAILVTGYPSQNSAIKAVHLPVLAYMVKPLDFEELVKNLHTAVSKRRLFMAVKNTQDRLAEWQNDIGNMQGLLTTKDTEEFSATGKSFIELTFSNIIAALSDIQYITSASFVRDKNLPVCHLLNCPKLAELSHAIDETVDVLTRTKDSFKSKELGKIRRKLEDLTKKMNNSNAQTELTR